MNFLLHIIIMACLFLFPVLGYNVVFGKGKILFFGQEGLSLVVVYTLWIIVMQFGMSYFTGALLAIVALIVTALLFAWLALRLDEDAFGVMSIAMHLVILAIILNWQSVTRGALGIPAIPRTPLPTSIEGFVLLMILVAAAWIAFIWWMDRGSFGRSLNALSEHKWHAQSLGISRPKIYCIAFLIAGMGSFISSTFFPPYQHLLTHTDYNFPAMIFFVMIVVAGKPGSVKGCAAAAFLIVFLKEGLRFLPLPVGYTGPTELILFGLILFGAVWWRRDVLFPRQRTV
jgi:branched-chain amino acid transport system permease protein